MNDRADDTIPDGGQTGVVPSTKGVDSKDMEQIDEEEQVTPDPNAKEGEADTDAEENPEEEGEPVDEF